MKIGELIKEYRTKNKLSMQEFAERADLSKGYISMLEKGVNPSTGKKIIPSITSYSSIAKALGMTLGELLHSIDPNESVGLEDPDDAKSSLDQLEEDFPEGVSFIRRANKELTPESKKRMIELMKLFMAEVDAKDDEQKSNPTR